MKYITIVLFSATNIKEKSEKSVRKIVAFAVVGGFSFLMMDKLLRLSSA